MRNKKKTSKHNFNPQKPGSMKHGKNKKGITIAKRRILTNYRAISVNKRKRVWRRFYPISSANATMCSTIVFEDLLRKFISSVKSTSEKKSNSI